MAKLPTIEQMKFRRYPPLKSGPPILWPTKRYFRRNEGTTDYATIPEVTLTGDFVIEFDILTSSTVDFQTVFSNSSQPNELGCDIQSNGSIRVFNFNATGDLQPTLVSSAGWNDGKLHKVLISLVGGIPSISIDGAVTTGSQWTTYNGAKVNTLQKRASLGREFSGILANLKIYDNGTLVRDYPLDDNSDTIRDKANGQNGTIINGNASDWGLFDKQANGDWKGNGLSVPPWDSVDQILVTA
ncbi:LamG-like jellyroll fold domain-containing protein [uncultured Alteromonas sp.]|uniref:LamG-like jellyroll fold domain-containing protein n=1 Tax=uncultured Alteromonas sp. TaxID=179113 RepID=UPI0030EE903C|tara:strand:+ start:2540 stop:3265 length:726 start_codon:yes stop_codon:yes gene_type:complete